MKSILFFILSICLIPSAYSQVHLNGGVGYFGEKGTSPGAVLEFEYENYFSENFSLPLRADLGFFTTPDYNVLFVGIHKGFRKYLPSGVFFEQSIGVGMSARFYSVESIWYYDKYLNVTRYKDGANWGFSPSVSFGAGYDLTHKKETKNLIWIRPKIFWNLGFRGLHLPYAALQIGFTHTFKTK